MISVQILPSNQLIPSRDNLLLQIYKQKIVSWPLWSCSVVKIRFYVVAMTKFVSKRSILLKWSCLFSLLPLLRPLVNNLKQSHTSLGSNSLAAARPSHRDGLRFQSQFLINMLENWFFSHNYDWSIIMIIVHCSATTLYHTE